MLIGKEKAAGVFNFVIVCSWQKKELRSKSLGMKFYICIDLRPPCRPSCNVLSLFFSTYMQFYTLGYYYANVMFHTYFMKGTTQNQNCFNYFTHT